MPISGKRVSPGKPEIIKNEGKGGAELPGRKALLDLAKGKKTINDYSKAGRSINDYPPSND